MLCTLEAADSVDIFLQYEHVMKLRGQGEELSRMLKEGISWFTLISAKEVVTQQFCCSQGTTQEQ